MNTSLYVADAARDTPPIRTSKSQAGAWSLWHRIAFRFVSPFIFLLIFPFPFGHFPGDVIRYSGIYDKVGRALVAWVSAHILHITLKRPLLGLYDATSGYVTLFVFVIIAILAGIVWTALDRKRKEYRKLNEWLRIYARYMLAFTMLAYGMDKIFALQFIGSKPGISQLAKPLGDFSRYSLFWTLMGASTPYTIFSGLAEVAGAMLLFFRRTTTLGALIVCAVMTNVVMLNFCYGVPVKLFSSSLLLLAIVLAAPDTMRLANMLVFNRPVAAVDSRSPFRRQWMKIPHIAVKTAAIAFSLYWFAGPFLHRNRVSANAPKSPLYGLYRVDSFLQDGKPMFASDSGWRRVAFDRKNRMTVIAMDDSAHYYMTDYDEPKNTVSISEKNRKGVLTYQRLDPEHIELRGTLENKTVIIEMRKMDISKFPMLKVKFRWAFDE